VLRQSGTRKPDQLGRAVEVFEVVDGQQRLTTVALLILALYDRLRDQPAGEGIWRDFVEEDGVARLESEGVNAQYLRELTTAVRQGTELPNTSRATNRRMRNCICFFREQLKVLSALPNAPSPQDFVAFVREKLRILFSSASETSDHRSSHCRRSHAYDRW
jgi:hypothetical protein